MKKLYINTTINNAYGIMMKITLVISLIGACQFSFAQQEDIDELKKLNQRWLDSYPKKDSATLANIFADDFVLISPRGVKMTKQDILGNLKNQETSSVKVDSIDVRLLTAEVGLITVYTTFVMKVNGKDMTGKNCYQDVYVKRRGRWWAVAAHVTLLNMN